MTEIQAFHGVVSAAMAAYGDLRVKVPAAASERAREAAEWDAATAALSSALATARRQLEDEVRAARLRTLSAEGARLRAVVADSAPQRAAGTAAKAGGVRESASVPPAGATRLAEILARLPFDSPADIVGRCERLAAAYQSLSSPAEEARVLDGIRFEVQAAQDRQARIKRNGAAIEALYRELDGLRGEQADTLRGVLKGLDKSAELPADLRERVAVAKAAAEADRDREFVLEAAAKALSELGYTVGDEFRTAVPGSGAVLDLPHSAQHGVRIRERNKRLQLNVVRFDATGERDRLADSDAEDAFCRDFARVKERLREAGVDLTMLRADPPGQTPVQVSTDVPRSRTTPRAAGRSAQASRERRRQP